MDINLFNFMSYSEADKLTIWQKGHIAYYKNSEGKTVFLDATVFRTDDYGSLMQYSEYGNRDSQDGWEVDHIKPKSKGGPELDRTSNLRPLQWENNANKGDKYPWP